jgi:Fe-S-cluster containining protein
MSLSQIIEGTVNNILNNKEQLYNFRISICRKCPLITSGLFGEECNAALYVNPQTNEVSKSYKPGFISGCGCILRSKTRVVDANCPIGK